MPADLVVACREDPDRNVPDQFHERAAHADREHLPERRVGLSPDDQFEARFLFCLKDDPLDLCFGIRSPDILRDGSKRLFCRRSGHNAGNHAARIALVDDLRRDDLCHEREPDPVCCTSRLFCGVDDHVPGHRDPTGFQQFVAFRFREQGK